MDTGCARLCALLDELEPNAMCRKIRGSLIRSNLISKLPISCFLSLYWKLPAENHFFSVLHFIFRATPIIYMWSFLKAWAIHPSHPPQSYRPSFRSIHGLQPPLLNCLFEDMTTSCCLSVFLSCNTVSPNIYFNVVELLLALALTCHSAGL